ncbi:porin [Paraburkholderia sp. BL6665CI2N2]|uniref:porin n=1 Tax=Paraburkholderia sp. BL6665CI2N2 TaxID=1938806 RepID=UPI0010656A56
MKNKSLVLLSALCFAAEAAHAQSSVTLYGLIDAGSPIPTVTTETTFRATSGDTNGSRCG